MKPSIDILSSYFRIDIAKQGLVFVKDSGRWGKYKAGTRAGGLNKSGHRMIQVEGKYFPESNVVWALHYGAWPTGFVSNLNDDLQDNRPENLYISSPNAKVKSETDIPIERLRFLFSYNAMTGDLIRNVDKPPNGKAGDIVGTLTDGGYLKVAVDGRTIRIHRIAWAMQHGYWPIGRLDHKNRIRSANWIENLRPATSSENMQNTSLRSDNISGYKGVHFYQRAQKYRAVIQVDKKLISLGSFDRIEDAIKARKEAETLYHPYRKAI